MFTCSSLISIKPELVGKVLCEVLVLSLQLLSIHVCLCDSGSDIFALFLTCLFPDPFLDCLLGYVCASLLDLTYACLLTSILDCVFISKASQSTFTRVRLRHSVLLPSRYNGR